MRFTGKPVCSGTSRPDVIEHMRALAACAEDLSDIVQIVAPYETPLLEHLGDARKPALSKKHIWADDGERTNHTKEFSAPIEVSGSMQAVKVHGVQDELNYQKQERIRELLRDLENTVINGRSACEKCDTENMNGILAMLKTNVLEPGTGGIPDGAGGGGDILNEGLLKAALKRVWENSSGSVDTIVVGGAQKRRINEFSGASTRYTPESETVGGLVNTYESDFGFCNIVLSRWMPANSVLLLDSCRISVMPLAGRSFHYKAISSVGSSVRGLVVGEYTLELLNESAHGVIRGLGV